MPRTFYKCPRCGSQLLMLRRMVWQAFDGTTHELGPVADPDWDESLEAYCRECDPDANHIFELRQGGIVATPHMAASTEKPLPPAEIWYCWRELAVVEGFEHEGQRLLIPWSDPNEYEYAFDFLYRTAQDALDGKGGDDAAAAEPWVLCKLVTEPVGRPQKIEYFSEEDKALANAVELLREAADACDAADPQARDAILSLAHDLAASVSTKS